MVAELPAEYLDGIAGIEVSPKTLPHPVRADIWTLGECVPLPGMDHDPDTVQSQILLYHGSFQALADSDPEFDWREEAWETLTHELRHHLEWRARAPDLEALDEAAEANYARQDGEPFDPLYYRDGEPAAPGVFRVEDDFFLEQVVRSRPARLMFSWHGRHYEADPPEGMGIPAFLTVTGVADPPPGDLHLVLLSRPHLWDLFRRPALFQGGTTARPAESEGTQ